MCVYCGVRSQCPLVLREESRRVGRAIGYLYPLTKICHLMIITRLILTSRDEG